MNLRKDLQYYIALNNYVSAYRDNNQVPAEYTQIEYVERPSGNTEQCVETTWKPNMAKDIVIQGKATFMGSDTNYRPILLGNYTGNRTSTLNIEFDSRTDYNFRVYSLAQNSNTGVDLQVGPFTTNSVVEFNVNITGSTGALDVSTISNGITLTGSSTVQNIGEQTNNVMMLFKDHRATTTSASKVPTRIYYLKAIEDGITKIDLIPAIRNSDSEVGFYDKVSGQFLTNSGTGSLTGGSSIVEFDSNKLELTDAIHDGLEDLVLHGSTKVVPTEYLDTVSAKGNSNLQGIPLEYTQVEYIQNATKTLVPTDFIPVGVTSVKVDLMTTVSLPSSSTGRTFYIFQARETTATTIFGISGAQASLLISGSGTDNAITSTITRTNGNKYHVVWEAINGTQTLTVDDLTAETTDTKSNTYTTIADVNSPMCLFGNAGTLDPSGTATEVNRIYQGAQVYYAKLWVNGKLVLDLVPAKRNSDNTLGFYNKANGSFYTASEGSLTAGNEIVPTPSDPMDIYCNNGILVPYLDGIGSTTQSSVPTPTSPISMINYTQGNVELRAVGTYKDILTHGSANATITRNVGVKVFDGTEEFSLVSGYTDVFRTPNTAIYPSDFASNPDSNVGLCNNYKVLSTSTSLASNIQDGEMGWNTNGALTVKDSRFTTATAFKSWLAQMYAAGTPVVLYYPLATSTTESVPPAYGTGINRDYEELEYITADGASYIQTDLSGTARWVGSGQGTSESSGSKCILSALSNDANVYLASRFGTSQTAGKSWTIGITHSQVPTLSYAEYDINFASSLFTGKINGEAVSRNNSFTFTTWTIGTAFGTGTTQYPFVGNIYTQKAYQNGKLVGDFRPARRKSDGVIGMYDAVSNKFYTNSGTGDFAAGPSVHRNIFNANDITGQTVSGVTLSVDPITGVITTTGATTTTNYSNFTYNLSKPLTAGTYTVSVYNSETMSNSLVGFSISGVVSTRNVSFSTTTNNTATFTIPEGSVSDQVQIRIAGFADDPTHQFKFKIQVEEGSTGTSYINSSLYLKNLTYKSSTETLVDQTNHTATCQDLYSIDGSTDAQEIISGVINRNCHIVVLNGTENNWLRHSTYYWFYNTDSSFDWPADRRLVLCNSLPNLPLSDSQGKAGQFVSVGHNSGTTSRLIIANNFDSSLTVADFKRWLAQKYAEGDPIIVVYPASTTTTKNTDPQVLKKAPVEITQAALPGLTVDTTNKTISDVSPDYPLDIACNNGIIGVVDKSDWTTVIGGSGAGTAMYINPNTGKWTYVSVSSDQGSGFIIPIKVGKTYTLVSKNPSGSNSTILRYGQYSDGIMPIPSQGGDNGKQLIKWNAYSSGNVNKSITFRAEQPYLIIQISYSNMTATGGGINTISLIESNASSTDYEELEYLEATGIQYIDTGILAGSDIKAEVKYKPTNTSAAYCALGGRDFSSGDNRNAFGIWANVSGKTRFDFQSASVLSTLGSSTSSWNIAIKDGVKNYFNGTQEESNTTTTFASTRNMYLFAMFSGSSVTGNMVGSIAYCRIWKAGVLVRDFIPAKRNSDSVIGMYDRVSGTFFTNSGSDDFTAGPSKGTLQNTETTYVNSKNLYNTATDTDGQYLAEDGTIGTSSTSCYSDIIPVVAGEIYTWSGICGNSGNNNNKRVHAYVDGVWNQQVSFRQIDANIPFSTTFTVPMGCNGIRISHWITDKYGQIEKGYRPTRYEVYGRDVIKPLNLLSAGIYSDNQNITTGITTHKIGVIVFDGNEDWTWTTNANAPARLAISELEYNPSTTTPPLICSHFNTTAWDNLNATTKYTPYIAMNATQVATAKRIVFTTAWNNAIVDVDTWKAWLKDQYDRGTPVTVIYPITTAYTETNNPQDILLTSSNSEIERDSEYINNLGISVNYKKLR